MLKEVYFFTEMGYTAYSQDRAIKQGYNNLMFPNEQFDPQRASELYGMYFEELQYCTESGFDGVMINEHHNNPLCMMPSVNVIGSALSRTTKKGKIVFLGNVLPIHENPLRVAEEIAMIDMLSGGRVVCGFVRGIGQESMATNTNPVYNRERFDEAHDLIVKAWTTPGPFRWEGKHYNFRVVNPWVLPLQKPHPPIWIPGVASPESVTWAARHRYPYVALAPPLDLIEEIYQLYDKIAAEEGFTPTPEHRGLCDPGKRGRQRRKGLRGGQKLLLAAGDVIRHCPPSLAGASRIPHPGRRTQGQRQQRRASARYVTPGGPSLEYQEAQETYQIVTGNPDTVIAKLKHVMDIVDPGYMVLWGRERTNEPRGCHALH